MSAGAPVAVGRLHAGADRVGTGWKIVEIEVTGIGGGGGWAGILADVLGLGLSRLGGHQSVEPVLTFFGLEVGEGDHAGGPGVGNEAVDLAGSGQVVVGGGLGRVVPGCVERLDYAVVLRPGGYGKQQRENED